MRLTRVFQAMSHRCEGRQDRLGVDATYKTKEFLEFVRDKSERKIGHELIPEDSGHGCEALVDAKEVLAFSLYVDPRRGLSR